MNLEAVVQHLAKNHAASAQVHFFMFDVLILGGCDASIW
jgi:hypothetical protein